MFGARILADSVCKTRITTMELTYPRCIHSEFMTHRTFCLAGDSMLEFDLPGGSKKSRRRIFPMRLDEFVDKWHNGARRVGAKPKMDSDLSIIESEQEYRAKEAAELLGLANATNINRMCREGVLPGRKNNLAKGEPWLLKGKDIVAWRESVPEDTRYDMRDRLKGMRIRQLNEDTGDIQYSHVTDCIYSGLKEVFESRQKIILLPEVQIIA